MRKTDRWDIARQVTVVVGALFQVVAGAGGMVFGLDIPRVADENSSLVVPADYAFIIWNPIFLLAFAYAVYQALPSKRTDPLLRKIGWFAALGFFSNGLWELLYPTRQYVLAQLVFFGILAGAGVVYLIAQRGIRAGATPSNRVERWLIAPAFGLFFGWVTAAILVGFVGTLVAVGVFAGGTGEALVGALLLILGGLVASAVLLISRGGPLQGTVTYGVAVLWALVGVIVNQYRSEEHTSE